MFEIGRTRILKVRKGGKTVMGADGQPETKIVSEALRRITRKEYGHNSTHNKKLVVTLHGDDTITIKPYRVWNEAMAVTFNVGVVYKTMLAQRHFREGNEKARQKREATKEARARRAYMDKERRFLAKVRAENAVRAA